MTFEEFCNKTLKRGEKKKKVEITNSWGVKWYQRYYIKRSKYKIEEKLYRQILEAINYQIVHYIIEDQGFQFPSALGKLVVVKHKHKPYDTKHHYKIVDWKETLKLWYEDEECREKKQKVLRERKEELRFVFYRNFRLKNNKFLLLDIKRPLKMKMQELIANINFEQYG